MLHMRQAFALVLSMTAVLTLVGCESATERERLEKAKVHELDESSAAAAPAAGSSGEHDHDHDHDHDHAAHADEKAAGPQGGQPGSPDALPPGHPAVKPVESHGPKVEGKAGEAAPVGSVREGAETGAEAGSGTAAGSASSSDEAGSASANCTCSKDKPSCQCGHCSGAIGECHCRH